jgi:S-adenosylmethionine synthetase
VALSYSIGLTQPASLQVNTFGTSDKPQEDIRDLVNTHFDFRLGAILRDFNLRHLPAMHPEGFYQRIAAYGHVGRDDMDLPWETTDRAERLASG